MSSDMPDENFWALLDPISSGDGPEITRTETVAASLSRLPIPRIIGFHLTLLEKCQQALTWSLWEAADIIHGDRCSEDAFLYFRLWLVSRGRRTFSAAIADADSLSADNKIRALAGRKFEQWNNDEFPHMESLLEVAALAYDLVLEKLPSEVAKQLPFPEEIESMPKEIPDQLIPADFGGGARIRHNYPGLVALFSFPL